MNHEIAEVGALEDMSAWVQSPFVDVIDIWRHLETIGDSYRRQSTVLGVLAVCPRAVEQH